MGYFRQHTIVVTSFYEDIEIAHKKASEIFPIVSELLWGVSNSFRSFFIPPDGSKEDWPTSDEWDAKRDQFIEWLRGYHVDRIRTAGANELDWVEIQFADEAWETKIVRSSNHDSQAWGERRDAACEFERRYFPDPLLTDLAARLRTILSGYTSTDLSGLGPDDSLAEGLGIQDGLNLKTFLRDIDDEFVVEIPVAEAERMLTLRDYVAYIAQARKAKQWTSGLPAG